MVKKTELITLVKKISDNYKKIIDRNEIAKHPNIDWGNNGIGDRFARKLFNYTVIKKSGEYKIYSDNDESIDEKEINLFITTIDNTLRGIVGIKIHSLKTKNTSRPIREDIKEYYKIQACVVCGSNSNLICDHKNDLYDDTRVLDRKTQKLEDFQSLCTHCNLQKRQVCKKEKETKTIYQAKNIPMMSVFNPPDVTKKEDSYWYDPVVYCKKIKETYDKQIKNLEEEIKNLLKENESIKKAMPFKETIIL
jgi:hypothetical protein